MAKKLKLILVKKKAPAIILNPNARRLFQKRNVAQLIVETQKVVEAVRNLPYFDENVKVEDYIEKQGIGISHPINFSAWKYNDKRLGIASHYYHNCRPAKGQKVYYRWLDGNKNCSFDIIRRLQTKERLEKTVEILQVLKRSKSRGGYRKSRNERLWEMTCEGHYPVKIMQDGYVMTTCSCSLCNGSTIKRNMRREIKA